MSTISELEARIADLEALVGEIPQVQAVRRYRREEAERVRVGEVLAMGVSDRNAAMASMTPAEIAKFMRAAPNRVEIVNAAPDERTRTAWLQHLDPHERLRADLARVADADLPPLVFLVAADATTDANVTRRWRTTGGRREIDATQAARLTELGLEAMVSYRGENGRPMYLSPSFDPGDRIELPSREAVEVVIEMSNLGAARDRGDLRIEDGTLEQRRAAWLAARGA